MAAQQETTEEKIKRIQDWGQEWYDRYWDLKNGEISAQQKTINVQGVQIESMRREIKALKELILIKGYLA